MALKYCTNCVYDCGGWPCLKGKKIIRNAPNSCELFTGELYTPQKRKVNTPECRSEYDGTSPIKLTYYEVCNTFNTDLQDHVLHTYSIEGKELENIFKRVYPSDRSLRYCNGYRIQFADKTVHKLYNEWKKTGVTIEMYYGNGTVD